MHVQFRSAIMAMTEWAVECGDDTEKEFYNESQEILGPACKWEAIQAGAKDFGDFNLEEGTVLKLRCDVIKINQCVLLIFQSAGSHTAMPEMETEAKKWMGKGRIHYISDFSRDFIKELQSKKSKVTDQFPFGAEDAVFLEDDYCRLLLEKKIGSFIPLAENLIKEFPLQKSLNETEKLKYSCNIINGFIVTFFTGGFYSNREAHHSKMNQWFPFVKSIILKEELSEFVSKLASPALPPIAYNQLKEDIESGKDYPDFVL